MNELEYLFINFKSIGRFFAMQSGGKINNDNFKLYIISLAMICDINNSMLAKREMM
jgi:hypothetical protein